MSRRISTMQPDARVQHVAELVRGFERTGQLSATAPALVTYERVRGASEPLQLRARLVGLAWDDAKLAYALVLIDDDGRLRTLPLTVLVSIEPA